MERSEGEELSECVFLKGEQTRRYARPANECGDRFCWSLRFSFFSVA